MPPKPTTLREKAAQLVFGRLGSNLPPRRAAEEDRERLEALLQRCPLGGVILFNAHWPGVQGALARLQQESAFPLLVSADVERGIGQEVEGATIFPHAMAFGALERNGADGGEGPAMVEEMAKVTAREAHACGIHITFAPVADVNLTSKNPIIATRAFGSAPEEVARLVRAYLRGCRAEGLLATPKHFPGHGRTTADPHAERPVVEAAREELEQADFVPFRAAFEEGADLVMSAHVTYPALDDSGPPATASPQILKRLLREEMGFEGAVVSDSLIMGAVKDSHESAGAQAADLVAAGVDVLLDPEDPEAVVDGLVRAVEAGTLPEERIDEAMGRVWALKEKMWEHHGTAAFAPDPAAGPAAPEVGGAKHRQLARRIARQAVTVEANADGALPLPRASGDGLLFIRLDDGDADDTVLEKTVRETFPQAQYRRVGEDAEARVLDALCEDAGEAEAVVLTVRVEPAAWHAFGLSDAQQRFAEAVVQARPATVVVAALGSPHVLDAFPRAAARLCAYSDEPPSQRALVEVLAGQGRKWEGGKDQG